MSWNNELALGGKFPNGPNPSATDKMPAAGTVFFLFLAVIALVIFIIVLRTKITIKKDSGNRNDENDFG